MKTQIFSIIQIVLGLVLVGLVLLQQKGTGLGSAFGGDIAFYSTKRGVEKLLFYLTMIVAALFLISSIAGLIV